MEDAYERIARTRELVDCFVQVDGGVKAENVRAAHEAGADLLVVGTRHLRLRGPAAGLPAAGTSAGMSLRAGAGARSGSGRQGVSEADGRGGRRRGRRDRRRGCDGGGRAPRGGRRARGGGRACARRDALRDDGAVRPPRDDAAVRRRRPRRRDRARRRGLARPESRRPAAGSRGCESRGSRPSWRTASRRAARTRPGAPGRRSGGRSSSTRRRPRSTAASPSPASGGSPARSRAGSCTSSAPRPTPSRSGWAPSGSRTRGSTRATSTRRGSRAGSRSGAGRSPRAPSSSSAPAPLEDELRALAADGVQSLLLEGGPTLARAFLEAGLVDKLLLFVAPTLSGDGPLRRPRPRAAAPPDAPDKPSSRRGRPARGVPPRTVGCRRVHRARPGSGEGRVVRRRQARGRVGDHGRARRLGCDRRRLPDRRRRGAGAALLRRRAGDGLAESRQFAGRVNVEPALRAGDPLGGHQVQGHIDGTGSVTAVEPEGDGVRMRIALEPELLRYCAEKGSITVDGVSLTVAGSARGRARGCADSAHARRDDALGTRARRPRQHRGRRARQVRRTARPHVVRRRGAG